MKIFLGLMLVFLILILHPLFASGGLPVIIPVHRCAMRIPCIDIEVNETTQRVFLTLGSHFFSNFSIESIPINLESNSSQVYEYPVLASGDTTSSIGVGLSSPVTREHGSAALIKGTLGNDTLFFGISELEFNNSCIPDSIIVLSLDEPEWMVDGSVDLVPASGHALRSVVEPFFADIHSSKNAFHHVTVEPIFEHLRNQGAVGSGNRFDNCTAEGIASAPIIRLAFGDRSVQHIVMFPEDYIEFDESTNSCKILFSLIDSIDMWQFSPFTIPQTNVFVANQSLYICDSNV